MHLTRSNRWALLAVALLVLLTFGLILNRAAATPRSDHKEVICHPVNGKGSTGLGYSVVNVDKASSHFDKNGNPKHEADGRVDVYSDSNGHCPGYVEPEPSPTPTPSETPSSTPTPGDDPSETPSVTPTPTDEPTPTVEPSGNPTPTPTDTPTDVPTSTPPTTDGPPIPRDPVISTDVFPGPKKWVMKHHHKSGKTTTTTINTADIPVEEGF